MKKQLVIAIYAAVLLRKHFSVNTFGPRNLVSNIFICFGERIFKARYIQVRTVKKYATVDYSRQYTTVHYGRLGSFGHNNQKVAAYFIT